MYFFFLLAILRVKCKKILTVQWSQHCENCFLKKGKGICNGSMLATAPYILAFLFLRAWNTFYCCLSAKSFSFKTFVDQIGRWKGLYQMLSANDNWLPNFNRKSFQCCQSHVCLSAPEEDSCSAWTFFFLSWLLKYFWKRGICSYKANILARIPKGYFITMSDPLSSGLLLWAVWYLKHLCTIALGHFLFFLPQFPDYLPCSVCLQPAPRDVDKVRPVGHLCLSW